MEPIDLRVASVREARNADRRFCFEVITPHFTRVYQATSEEDMKSWIFTINNALQGAVEGKGLAGPVPSDSPTTTNSIRKDIASVLTGKSASTNHRSGHGSNKTVGRHATVGDRPSYFKPQFEANNESSQKLLQKIRDADVGNKFCADCGSESKVDWVSINLGVIICIECSGIHRSLGTHVSKVRSLTLDPNAFTPDVIEILLTIGNHHSNMVWEARLDFSLKPGPQSSREQRLRFITAKYSDRAYIQPITASLSHYASPDETLMGSIKKNDIQNVLYALALRANPNAVDRSRGTHAVFLALAAADPASPSGPSTPSVSPSARGSPPSSRKAFAIAELLLLNGAELPLSPAPIPLSHAAKQYLEGKIEQKNGRKPSAGLIGDAQPGTGIIRATGSTLTDAVGVGTGGDTLTALPFITPGTGTGSPGERRKRMSSGGRLIKLAPTGPANPPSSVGGGSSGTLF
jgi:Arf-GAP/SH3 domain/ANK repeat/PH domain-containing protein